MKPILTLLTLLLLSSLLPAEDLVLSDGRYLQVKILNADEKGVQVRLIATGGEIWIPWVLIRESDRDRIMIQKGLKEDASQNQILEDGIRLRTRSGDEYFGVPVTEFSGNQIPDEVTIWHRGSQLTFKRSVIKEVEWLQIPGLEAYTAEQLYDRKMAEIAPDEEDLEGHLEMARFSAAVELWEKAIMHLSAVRQLDPDYQPDYVTNQLARYEENARFARILARVKDAKQLAFYHHYDRALAILEAILSLQDGELSDNIRLDVSLAKDYIIKKRWEYYKREVRNAYYRFMVSLVRKKSRDHTFELQDARRWVRRDLHKEIVAAIADKFGLDPKKEVQKMWEDREVHGSRTASYGSGSFIVLGQAKGARERRQRLEEGMRQAAGMRGGRGNNAQGSVSAQPMKFPEPPTKDEWWARADGATKAHWMIAYYAENGRQLKVTGERRNPCDGCGATGTRKFQGQQGETIAVTCPTCAGHRFHKGVAYR